MATQWQTVDTQHRYEGIAIDPQLEWARVSDFVHLRPLLPRGERPVSLLLELTMPAAEFVAGAWTTGDWWKAGLSIPKLYARPAAGLKDCRFCTAIAGPAFFANLGGDSDANSELRKRIARFQFGLPTGVPPEPGFPAEWRGAGRAFKVVTGIIDDVLAVAHERFRRSDGGARVEWFWDQDAPRREPAAVPYGREYSGTEITQAIKANKHGGLVDEDAVYRELQLEDYRSAVHKGLGRRTAHGTHVMDLACGFDPRREPSADERPIIGVQLPVRSVRDTSGAFLWPQVYDGLRYIIDRADALRAAADAAPLPVVVNLSYGGIAGPHDGSSPLEAAIDDLITQRSKVAPFQVVIAAGNSYLGRCHAQVALAPGGSRSLDWRILPDGRTPSILEIWLPDANSRVTVEVETPTGDRSRPIGEADHYVWRSGGAALCQAIYASHPSAGGRPLIQVIVDATATLDSAKPVAPCGVWRVHIENRGPAAVIDAWIQRNDTPFGWPILGRQSYFDDPNYVRFDRDGRERQQDDSTSYVKRAMSLNSIATGEQPVVIGGARHSDGTIASYSGAGPTAGRRTGPDAVAASDESPARYGIIAAGTRSGSVFRMTGTSVAAPQITRIIAERLAKGDQGDREAVQDLARGAAAGEPIQKRYGVYQPSAQPPLDARRGAGLIPTPAAGAGLIPTSLSSLPPPRQDERPDRQQQREKPG